MIPKFTAVDFVSFYIEIPVMILMYLIWLSLHRLSLFRPHHRKALSPPSISPVSPVPSVSPVIPGEGVESVESGQEGQGIPKRVRWFDLVDTLRVDLYRDEYADEPEDRKDDEIRERRVGGRAGGLWRVYYWVV